MNLSTNIFKIQFLKMLNEDITSNTAFGSDIASGFSPQYNITNSAEFYAPGDARIPSLSRKIQTRTGHVERKKRKKSRSLAIKNVKGTSL